jgi:hypothetical protein
MAPASVRRGTSCPPWYFSITAAIEVKRKMIIFDESFLVIFTGLDS